MNKKNHTLRHFIIYTLVTIAVLWGLLIVGTVLYGKFNAEGNAIVPISVGIFNDFGTTYLGALKLVTEASLWNFTHFWASIVWYIFVVLTTLSFFVTFIIGCIKKKGKYIFTSFINLVLCCAIGYAYLGLYYTNYFNATVSQPGALLPEFASLLIFRQTAYYPWWGLYAWGYVLATVMSLIGVIGIYIVTLKRLFKKETVAETVAVVEETKVTTETPVETSVQEKKKGVLVLKRYDKYGQTGPVLESKVTTYPEQPIVSKPLTQDEIRNIIRDEFERQEALRLAEEYKQEKNAQLIAEAIVKATNANNGANIKPDAEETCACTCKEAITEEEKKVYPSPIVFAMPASARDEFYPKEVKESKSLQPKKESKPKLTEQEMRDIIADEISKALKDFVITKETIIEKPVEVKVTSEVTTEEHKEEDTIVEETKVEPVVTETPVEEKVVEEVTTETPVKETIIDETVKEEVPVEETLVEEAPAATEPVEETVTEELKVEEIKTEETPVEEVKVPEIDPNIPLTSNGTPKIIRIPFTNRMMEADDGLKAAYNELKSLLKSYGLNNRVSNSGDAFRLHRVTYCKITVAGKSLKLYLALNPADYADTTYPVKDASSKAIYKETPLVFKVKSGLSLRRGEELIRDCMDKHGLEQIDQVQLKDWTSDLANTDIEDDGQDSDDEE